MKDIFLVHDYITPYGELENGLNFDYFYSYIEKDFNKYHDIIADLQKKYYDGVSVWIGQGTISYAVKEELSTYDVFANNHKTDGVYLYPISPFGGASCAFGINHSLHQNRSFFFFIPEKTKYLIRTLENFYLFINYSNEGTLDTNFFEVIYKDAEEFNIPFEKIIFCISDYDIKMSFDAWYQGYKNRPDVSSNISKIKILYHTWSLRDKAKEFKKILNNEATVFNHNKNKCTVVTKEEVTDKIVRQKRFLMLNRRLRPHRLYSILLCSHLNLLNEFYISYDLNNMEVFELEKSMYTTDHLKNEFPFELVEEEYKKLKMTAPVSTLDFKNLQDVWGFNFEDKRIYQQSYIHITSETNFFENGGYFSEKTWKPIGHLQPFIFLGPANGLKEIKKLGFKTFSPFIDESYDEERNNAKRFKMIINEIERLAKLPLEEIHNWYHSIFEDILIYNQELFIQYENDDLMKNFFTKNLFEVLDVNT
jgi:hypothetical protein